MSHDAFMKGQERALGALGSVRNTCATGDELYNALVAFIGPLHPLVADQMRGFARVVQKRIEQCSLTSDREAT